MKATKEERDVLLSLADAWNSFVRLPIWHPDDHTEFRQAIHAAQCIVAARIASRADPALFYQPSVTSAGEADAAI